jgi:hypothetical protein
VLNNHRFQSPENPRAERFRPILDELAALPAAAVAATLNVRSVPSPRGGRWYEAQVIRMRKRLAAGPHRKTRKGLLERDRMDEKERGEEPIDSATPFRGAAAS